jgi:hypothetical protein
MIRSLQEEARTEELIRAGDSASPCLKFQGKLTRYQRVNILYLVTIITALWYYFT